MTFEISCKGRGIFSMGNIMPESRTVGIISTIPENSMASTWVRAIVETNNPNSRDTTMKIHESKANEKDCLLPEHVIHKQTAAEL